MSRDTDTVSQEQWNKFFRALEQAYSVSKALNQARISRATAYRYKASDRFIQQRWEESLLAGVEFLEDTARKRAVVGVRKETPHFYKDKLIGTSVETRYSDSLLALMLGARDARYRSDSNSRVLEQVKQELTKMLDVLYRKLPPDTYAQIIDILSNSDDVIDASATISAAAPKELAESSDL